MSTLNFCCSGGAAAFCPTAALTTFDRWCAVFCVLVLGTADLKDCALSRLGWHATSKRNTSHGTQRKDAVKLRLTEDTKTDTKHTVHNQVGAQTHPSVGSVALTFLK